MRALPSRPQPANAHPPGPPRALASAAWLGSLAAFALVGLSGPSVAAPPLTTRWPVLTLPWASQALAITLILWIAYLLGGWALWATVRAGGLAWRGPWRRRLGIAVTAAVVFGIPFGTADHTSYLAYGQIWQQGGDPWAIDPSTWRGGADPLAAGVQPPWQHTPNMYGPVGTAALAFSARLAQGDQRQGIWVWQLLVVLAWWLSRQLLVALARDGAAAAEQRAAGPQAGRTVDTWFTFNPLVVGPVLWGAHLDLLALAITLTALVLVMRSWSTAALTTAGVRRWVVAGVAGVFLGMATASKVTYGLCVLAVIMGMLSIGRQASRRWFAWMAVALTGATGITTWLLLSLAASDAVFAPLRGAGGLISVASPWRPAAAVLEQAANRPTAVAVASWGSGLLGLTIAGALLTILLVAAASHRWGLADRHAQELAAGRHWPPGHQGLLRWWLSIWQQHQPRPAWIMAGALWLLFGAYTLSSSYVLPWYLLPMWAGLAVVGPALLCHQYPRWVLAALIGWATALASCYVPGRTVLPPELATLTLGVRAVLGPAAAWAAIAVVLAAAWRSYRSFTNPHD